MRLEAPADGREQQQLLGDLLQLMDLMLGELPSPVGCNNTSCVRMEGLSEYAAALKTCKGCRVAGYCNRQCQTGHWQVHKATCKRLQKGKGEEQQQQKDASKGQKAKP